MLEGAVLLGHALERFGDLGVGDLGHRLRDRHVRQVGQLEVRQNLEGDGEGQIALGVHGLLDLFLALGELDLRLVGELQAVVLDDLAVGLVDGVLQHVGHDGAAIDLAQVPHRHLARAEPVEPHPVLEGRQFAVQALFQLGGREHDLELSLQALGQCFRHLHGTIRLHPLEYNLKSRLRSMRRHAVT